MSFFKNIHAAAPTNLDPVDVGEIRSFTAPTSELGGGCDELEVPGCLEVLYVRIGNGPALPKTFPHTFIAANGNPPILATEQLPSWSLETREDGIPVLLRNNRQNFGRWQEKVNICVGGVWAKDEPKPPTEPEPKDPPTDPPTDPGKPGEGQGQKKDK